METFGKEFKAHSFALVKTFARETIALTRLWIIGGLKQFEVDRHFISDVKMLRTSHCHCISRPYNRIQ